MLAQPLNSADAHFQPRGNDIPAHVAAVMDIDLGGVAHNYHYLQSLLAPGAQSAAVLKANAYGMGAAAVGPVLAQAGCREFYVATVDEAIALRQVLPGADLTIMLLNGLLPGMEALCLAHRITPVLNAPEQVALWASAARACRRRLPAALHFDTGMCRVGLAHETAAEIAQRLQSEGVDVRFVLSHLACSDQPDHEKNAQQLARFQALLHHFPGIPASFSNSHGILLGADYHFQQVRPGRALYGVGSRVLDGRGFRQTVRVYTKVLQVRAVPAGESVGYSASHVMEKPARLAVLSMGYADGLLRTRTYKGVIQIQGHPAPIVGRISMDLLTVDVTQIPENLVYPGVWASYIGDHASVVDAAEAAGTISHEILVNLGARYHKNYVQAPAIIEGQNGHSSLQEARQ